MAKDAKELGAQGVLFHPPSLYPGFTAPQTEEFIIEHLKRLDEEVNFTDRRFRRPFRRGSREP